MKTITCPSCKRPFVPDADHRHGAACCALCARALTPRGKFTGYHAPNTSMSVLLKPSVNRMHGKNRTGKTE